MIKILHVQQIKDYILLEWTEIRKENTEGKYIARYDIKMYKGESVIGKTTIPLNENNSIPESFPPIIIGEELLYNDIGSGYEKVEEFPVYLKHKDPLAGKKTTEDIMNLFGVQRATATNWAAKNGVESVILPSGKAGFAWTNDDIERFKNRPKRGRRWNKEVDRKIVIG